MARLRYLTQCIYENEQYSKHGRYFSPFYEPLSEADTTRTRGHGGPMLLSVPFLDWSVEGETPPLRFQVDPREGYQSTRSSAHIMRSILQYFYRLEDTSDREHEQIFAKHKPWLSDRELDLKVRRWYGHYPSRLNVDELWILVIDSTHIVTFASNQSWKSRWPPLQVVSRIAEVSFRGIRNSMYLSEEDSEYTAYTHTIACLSGALGLLHRNFWTDLPLCLTERFSSYASNAQYRLLRSPSAKLVMDLLHVQEELNIIIKMMQEQIELVEGLASDWAARPDAASARHSRASSMARIPRRTLPRVILHPSRNPFKQFSASVHSDPMHQLLENLRREYVDLQEMRDNCNNLVNRTIQLVNIRLEDHGKAILVFTIVTIIFLPLSFVSSFFGMNTTDIRNMTSNQGIFWIVSMSLTVGVVGFAVFLAFYGTTLLEMFMTWKANRKIPKPTLRSPNERNGKTTAIKDFQVLHLD
jgi:Mg2+ and Co2+ transporter CorA